MKGAPNELIAKIERWVADDIPGARSLAAEKVNAGIEALVAAIDHIGCDCSIAGLTRSFGDAANATGWIPNGSFKLFDSKQPLADPARLHVPAGFFLSPNVCS